jgi:hypothetical protein
MNRGFIAASALAIVLAGCGGSGGSSGNCSSVQGSCTQATGCAEYGGFPSVATAQEACTRSGGTFSGNACSRASAVGGCRLLVGGACTTTWYYASSSATEDIVRQACAAAGATFVAP